MKPLSAAERSEIHELINTKRRAVREAVEMAHPGWEERLDERLQKIAIGKLKVEKDVAELARIEAQEQELADRKAEVEARIARRMPFEKSSRRSRGTCRSRMTLCDAIEEIKAASKKREQARDVAGKRVLAAEEAANRHRAILASCSTRADLAASGLLKELH